MERDEEMKLIRDLTAGQLLNIDTAAVVVIPSADGGLCILLRLVDGQGRDFVVPLERKFALGLGEAMVRAVDAIDTGTVETTDLKPK